jgi:hypothetical protein
MLRCYFLFKHGDNTYNGKAIMCQTSAEKIQFKYDGWTKSEKGNPSTVMAKQVVLQEIQVQVWKVLHIFESQYSWFIFYQ